MNLVIFHSLHHAEEPRIPGKRDIQPSIKQLKVMILKPRPNLKTRFRQNVLDGKPFPIQPMCQNAMCGCKKKQVIFGLKKLKIKCLG